MTPLLLDARAFASGLAALVAWRTRSATATIVVGILALRTARFLLG